jgi:hypothetical protein
MISRSHASAIRLVKNPLAGLPRAVHAGPIFFWTWRPSGSRYFAYQTQPSRFRSTRKTWPLTSRNSLIAHSLGHVCDMNHLSQRARPTRKFGTPGTF